MSRKRHLIALSRRMIRLALPLCFPNTEYIQYMPVRDSDTNNNFHHYQDSDFDTLQFSNNDKELMGRLLVNVIAIAMESMCSLGS
jgi:hypothetical protein